ncbi:peptidoglycan -binding protein [Rhodobacter sp. SGA-6-6]|uniref:peptidoglycan -binding protein n=1 Tax=Rhodobacter sp. SGA-6-6 TaxID=2710882 RepID=UPI0013EB910C|nr:peptidoglycan -binding protein [Rhodobacter sp. SGA-6-6]NGM44967.1 peptidoglycan -binding protein [Rhodobacter sp. SGA-6-6]
MALSRHRRDSSMIWPGFVDAVTTLLMVLMFVLTIFTVMQSVLRDTITTKDNELSALTDQVAALSEALGLEQKRAAGLQSEVGELRASLTAALAEGERRAGVIAGLEADLAAREGELAEARVRITDFEAQVAALLGQRDKALADLAVVTGERDESQARAEGLAASVAELEAAKAKLITEAEAAQLALASLRDEIDAQAEAARLDAAKRAALEALVKDLQAKGAEDAAALESAKTELSEAEAARLVDAAALDALRKKLEGADAELTAMTLALEEERRRAEETLTLLAAARTEAAQAAGEKDAALAAAETALLAEQEKALAAAREVELLNQQIAALRSQLGSLQQVLDEAEARDAEVQVQLESLGTQLNSALAQVAAEQKRRAELEEAERRRLEAEKADLERFRSEFFGQLSTLLQGREGVRVVGDRFVFSSEVLFNPGSADLAPEGRAQIAGVVQILDEIRGEIPEGIDWVIRVDGHTDNIPLSGTGEFRDNWELSQARALSVVRFMQQELGFPPERLAATGFGEYRPVTPGDSAEARAQNRRIELKLTER